MVACTKRNAAPFSGETEAGPVAALVTGEDGAQRHYQSDYDDYQKMLLARNHLKINDVVETFY